VREVVKRLTMPVSHSHLGDGMCLGINWIYSVEEASILVGGSKGVLLCGVAGLVLKNSVFW
jgi:hypothetical protein